MWGAHKQHEEVRLSCAHLCISSHALPPTFSSYPRCSHTQMPLCISIPSIPTSMSPVSDPSWVSGICLRASYDVLLLHQGLLTLPRSLASYSASVNCRFLLCHAKVVLCPIQTLFCANSNRLSFPQWFFKIFSFPMILLLYFKSMVCVLWIFNSLVSWTNSNFY